MYSIGRTWSWPVMSAAACYYFVLILTNICKETIVILCPGDLHLENIFQCKQTIQENVLGLIFENTIKLKKFYIRKAFDFDKFQRFIFFTKCFQLIQNTKSYERAPSLFGPIYCI